LVDDAKLPGDFRLLLVQIIYFLALSVSGHPISGAGKPSALGLLKRISCPRTLQIIS
jgi:hypothetical protein